MKRTQALWIPLFLFGIIVTGFAQPIPEGDYHDLVDEMICNFTELSLKEQKDAPHYVDFQKEIVDKGKCDYFGIRPFLRDRTPIPATTLEIVNTLHFEYKEGYNPNTTNRNLYMMLMDVFDEPKVKEFSASHPSSFPGFKTDMEGYLREYLGLNYEVDTVIEAGSEEELEAEREPTPKISTLKTNPPKPSLFANNLLFWGLLLVLLAIVAYFVYGYFKNNSNNSNTADGIIASNGVKNKNQYEEQISELKETVSQHKSKLANLLEEIEFLHGELNKLSAVAPEKFADSTAPIIQNNPLIKNKLAKVKGILDDIAEDAEETTDEKEETVEEIIERTNEIVSEAVETSEEEVEEQIEEAVETIDANNEVEKIVEEVKEEDSELEMEITNESENLLIKEEEEVIEEVLEDVKEEEIIENEIPIITTSTKVQPDTFYMPLPNSKGEFNNFDWKEEFDGNRSLYQFIMIGVDEATFAFVNDEATTKKALEEYDIYLKPVCYPLDIIDTNASKVITETAGQVYRENGIWKLRQKAMIYFEE